MSVGSLSAHDVLYLANMACHDELQPHTRALKGRFRRIRRLLRRDLMYHFGRCIAGDTSATSRIHQEKLMYLDVIGTTLAHTLDVLIHQLFAIFDVLM